MALSYPGAIILALFLAYTASISAQYVDVERQNSSRPGDNFGLRAATCGQSYFPMSRTRIVGGYEANEHSIPWIVSMRQYSRHFCGGTLIRVNQNDESDIVITAAHCGPDNPNKPNFEIVAGSHSQGKVEDGEQAVRAVRVVTHPKYSGIANDIALVKLARPIKFSKTIQPACLPKRGEQVADGSLGIVAGWGRLKQGGSIPDKLQQVNIPSVSFQKCQRIYGSRLKEESMLCGGYDKGGKDSCQGDSGGPYFFRSTDGYSLQGVVSWGAGCAQPNAPGVYARVSTYVDWIQEQIRTLSAVKG